MTDRRAFSVAVFARHAGRVLLIEHRRLGVWLPVGGEIEPGETPLEAARRELREETGLEGRFEVALGVDGTPPGLLGYEEHPAGSKGLHMNFAFVADVATDAIVPNDEILAHRWVHDAGDLRAPANVRELVRLALRPAASPLEGIARRWIEAFDAHDVEGVLALYADDAVHTSPKLRAARPDTEGVVRGRQAIGAWFREALGRAPSVRFALRSIATGDDRAIVEYDRGVDGEPPLRVVEVLVVREARIVASRAFHG